MKNYRRCFKVDKRWWITTIIGAAIILLVQFCVNTRRSEEDAKKTNSKAPIVSTVTDQQNQGMP